MQSTRLTRAERRAKKRRNQRIGLSVIILVVLALVAYIAYTGFTAKKSMETTASGLQYQDLIVGTGPAAQTGDTVVVHYTGYLADGTKFDSSLDRGQPFTLTLGRGQVIKGWEEGLVGMKVGGKRKLIIPPELAYGSTGAGGVIPPNATITFEVELLEIQ